MKPFAFLAARPATAAAIRADEYAVVARSAGLAAGDLRHFFLDERPHLDLAEFAGVIVSGSQYGFFDDPQAKTPEQLATEESLFALNERILAADFPYLGICYGHQSLAISRNIPLTKDHFEKLGAVDIRRTPAGEKDPVFAVLPQRFTAIVGHAEAIAPQCAPFVVLAESDMCPVQAIRYGDNVYGVQFHPEIDEAGLDLRLDYYNGSKYFRPGQLDAVRRQCGGRDYSAGKTLIRSFVERYRQH
ncbi:glutamine amidotransferase-related protein [Trueperella sp. LYQ143]|uniref:glutamine amidotransferase-related protein n=1 Tax=unclassified Trueperella TaxID=2630174 RepID=UPI0039831020